MEPRKEFGMALVVIGLSGFWNGAAPVAHHDGWLTDQSDRAGTSWVVGVSQRITLEVTTMVATMEVQVVVAINIIGL